MTSNDVKEIEQNNEGIGTPISQSKMPRIADPPIF